MPSRDLWSLSSQVVHIVERRELRQAQDALIYAIDGDRVDIRLLSSACIIRHVEVEGDIDTLQIGQEVALRWRDNRPVVMLSETAAQQAIGSSIGSFTPPDNQSIEISPYGLRVKAAGIKLSHLSFEPAMKDHIHRDDPFTKAGWQITSAGVIWKGTTYIHPTGQISLGVGSNAIKLDSQHDTYRLWSGAIEPENANFRVSKLGELYSYSGEIAGWTISATKLSKSNLELDPAGQIKVGTGNDVAILSSVNVNNWRLWVGHENPAQAPFRVNKSGAAWLESATIKGTLQSSNYVAGLSGWKLDNSGKAELQEVEIRGRISSSVFSQTTISTVAGQLLLSKGTVLIADVADDATTIDVENNTLTVGDIIHLKPSASRSEYMRIASVAQAISGGFRHIVIRNINEDPAGPFTFYKGEVCVYKGTAGITRDMFPLASGEEGGEFGEIQPGGGGSSSGGGWLVLDGESPFFGVVARDGPVWNQVTRVVQIGNLVGCPLEEYVTATYGIFVGDELDYMVYDREQGLRIKAGAGASSLDDDGVTTDALLLTKIDVTPDYVDERARFWFENDEGDLKIKIRMKDGATEAEVTLATEEEQTFLGLGDTPGSYVDQGLKYVRVNEAEGALEFSEVVIPELDILMVQVFS